MSARGALRGLCRLDSDRCDRSGGRSQFGLSPLGLAIGANELSGSVVVTNTGSDEIVIQARPYAWSQSGKESRADTRDLIVNPPIFKLAPGEQQLVRVASRSAAGAKPNERIAPFSAKCRSLRPIRDRDSVSRLRWTSRCTSSR